MTSTSAGLATPPPGQPPPPFPPAVVEEMLRLLGKAVRARQLYLPNNPIYLKAIEVLRASFGTIWGHTDELVLMVTETAFVWEGNRVLVDEEKGADSLPWIFYKDGVRELHIQRGFEEEEVTHLLDIIQRARRASPDEDDLITMLWEQDFANVRYRYVDLAAENAAAIDAVPTERPASLFVSPIEEEQEPEAPRPGIVNISDFDTTLYFLDDREVDYLQAEVRREYESNLRRDAVAIVLDIFEAQADAPVRDEIVGILEQLMVHLLAAGEFGGVAYLLDEVSGMLKRTQGVEPRHASRLVVLPDRLSDPDALAQLLQSLDARQELPPQEEMGLLFSQLRPTALGTIFAWLGKLQNPRLRTLLEGAADRLAASHTGELIRLIAAKEGAVALEAVRRAGALKAGPAVAPLSKLVAEPDTAMRLAAVQALAEIGSPGALQVLERSLTDTDRDVRVAAARALGARAYRPALETLEGMVRGRKMVEADLTEKMAFFEAYGAVCGDRGVPLLDGVLNPRRGLFAFLRRRVDPELRACAAMALGRIGSERALESLRQASSEREVLVRNAVAKALRGGG